MDLLSELKAKIKSAWSSETTLDRSNWASNNPAWGQCAVTALVVNDYMGGDIIWAEVTLPNGEKVSHYFNLINGKEVDLTGEQFPKGTVIPQGIQKRNGFATTRAYCLSSPETRERYEILRNKVKEEFTLESNLF